MTTDNNDLKSLIAGSGLDQSKVMAALSGLLDRLEKEQKAATKASRPPKEHGDVKVFMTVHRYAHCTHCGSENMRVIQLMQKEAISGLQKDGTVRTIYALNPVKEPVKMDSYTVCCGECKERVSRLSRVELEQAYMFLLSKMSYKEARGAFSV